MTKYLMILAALFALVACGGDDGNDPIDNESVDDNALPEIDTEQPDIDNTPAWTSYAGLEWSPLSENTMQWQDAIDYCTAMGARLPNINELRKIIINWPKTKYGGICQISDPDCLNWDCGKYEDCRCDGTADSYSALGDDKNSYLWSSSSHVDYTDYAWSVYFGKGVVDYYGKSGYGPARCVR